MYTYVHACAMLLLCDMTVMVSNANVRNIRNAISLKVFIYLKPTIGCCLKLFKYTGVKRVYLQNPLMAQVIIGRQ